MLVSKWFRWSRAVWFRIFDYDFYALLRFKVWRLLSRRTWEALNYYEISELPGNAQLCIGLSHGTAAMSELKDSRLIIRRVSEIWMDRREPPEEPHQAADTHLGNESGPFSCSNLKKRSELSYMNFYTIRTLSGALQEAAKLLASKGRQMIYKIRSNAFHCFSLSIKGPPALSGGESPFQTLILRSLRTFQHWTSLDPGANGAADTQFWLEFANVLSLRRSTRSLNLNFKSMWLRQVVGRTIFLVQLLGRISIFSLDNLSLIKFFN